MDLRMEIVMWTALIGGAAVVLRMLAEALIGLAGWLDRSREGFRRERLSAVPAHTVERLSRRRHR